MEIGETLYVTTAKAWRAWLRKNHRSKQEIWLVYPDKESGKPRISYDDAVGEALCYGWIDSTMKRLDAKRTAQRFTPRRPRSSISELNKARVRKLAARRRMTKAGFAALPGYEAWLSLPRTSLAPDLRRALGEDPEVWRNFRAFPDAYKAIRLGWIEAARSRPEIFRQRLRYFIRMTKKNKRYGMLRG